MFRLVALAGILFLGLLTGCDKASLVKKFMSPEDEATARRYMDLLRQRNFDQVEKDLDPSVKTPDVRKTLASMAGMFPAEEPASVKVVGVRKTVGTRSSSVSITLEYEFSHQWLLASVITQKRDGVASIAGFHVNSIPDSLENINRFTLVGKSGAQYAILLLAILSPLFSLYAFVLCIKTRLAKAKWIWLILTLIGVGSLGVNWTTGQTSITPFMIDVPPAYVWFPPYGAWSIYVSFPLGAVLFMLRRRALGKSIRSGAGTPEAQDSPAVQPIANSSTESL